MMESEEGCRDAFYVETRPWSLRFVFWGRWGMKENYRKLSRMTDKCFLVKFKNRLDCYQSSHVFLPVFESYRKVIIFGNNIAVGIL